MPVAISAENISKAYQLGTIGTGTLSNDLIRWLAALRGKEDPFLVIGEVNDRTTKATSQIVWSLKNINFEIQQGEAVGIIGRNGAGKSTLLKILSRITAPTTGNIRGTGRIASLLEVGTGFHPELTGRENIFLNGAILGMRKKEIARKFDEIVSFSGVERYIDTPVKRYSSGMYVRLAFAVAAHLETDIMIIDEVLAVGDDEFQKKCIGKMSDVRQNEGRTILFVSHNLGAIKLLCRTSIFLEKGELVSQGETKKIIKDYLEEPSVISALFEGPDKSDKKIWFKKIFTSNLSEELKDQFFHDEEIFINFELGFNIPTHTHDYSIFIIILDSNKVRITSSESRIITSNQVQMVIEPNFLVRGSYSIHTFIHKPRTEQIDVAEDVCHFNVIDKGSSLMIHGEYDYGYVFGRISWKQPSDSHLQ